MSKEQVVKCPRCGSTIPVAQANLLYVRIDNRGKPIEERLHDNYCLACRDGMVKVRCSRVATLDYWFLKAELKDGKVVWHEPDGSSYETDLKPGHYRNL